MHPVIAFLCITALIIALLVVIVWWFKRLTKDVPVVVQLPSGLYAIEVRYLLGLVRQNAYLNGFGRKVTNIKTMEKLREKNCIFSDSRSVESALNSFCPPTVKSKATTLAAIKTEELIDAD